MPLNNTFLSQSGPIAVLLCKRLALLRSSGQNLHSAVEARSGTFGRSFTQSIGVPSLIERTSFTPAPFFSSALPPALIWEGHQRAQHDFASTSIQILYTVQSLGP
jgi:hypothetical protein